ncbi:MAG: hypothetical protein E7578_09625 [Ruminococcaceae bacterium]|nr:hypothetical protein [Oscillospiraceae bacterium]
MKNTVIIGIAGGSAGGKSTFAKALSENIENSLVISMDSYFKNENDRRCITSPVKADKMYRDDNHPTSFDISKMAEDIRTAADSRQYRVIIAEGLLTLWSDEILPLLDLKIFVDCRSDERIVRRLRRNMTWGLSFDEIANVYLDMVRFRHDAYVEPTKWKSDIIVNGSGDITHAVEMIRSYVEKIHEA